MKWFVTIVGVVASIGVYLGSVVLPVLNAGIAFLVAAPLAAVWAYPMLARKPDPSLGDRPKAERGLIVAYEILIVGLLNVLAGRSEIHSVSAIGAAVAAAGQSTILWLVFRNPHIIRLVERPTTSKDLSSRSVLTAFMYVTLTVLACAIFIPRSGHPVPHPLPVAVQWPGIALLYTTLACLALGFASEHSKSSLTIYLAAAVVTIAALGLEFVGRRNWYFLGLSLFAFFCLVPSWPRTAERGPSESSVGEASEPNT